MYIGEVAGRVVSTVKTEGLKNIPLLVVQLIEKGRRTRMIVAADSTGQAGQGDLVYLIGSEHAAQVFRRELVPSDASIAGIDVYKRQKHGRFNQNEKYGRISGRL